MPPVYIRSAAVAAIFVTLLCTASPAPNCSLATVASTEAGGLASRLAAATADCEVVVYTTLAYPAGVRLPDPSTRLGKGAANGTAGVCYLIVAGSASAAYLGKYCKLTPWRIVALDDVAVEKGGGRRSSRLLKLLPLQFFSGARYIVFVDWKLALQRHPLDLIRRTLGSSSDGFGFAAFKHPCTTTTYAETSIGRAVCKGHRKGENWWRSEARIVMQRKLTNSPEALKAQVARYESSSVPLSYYIDGAILVWDVHHPAAAAVSCAWWAEYDRADSSDRDQFAFASAIMTVLPPPPGSATNDRGLFPASTRANGIFLIHEGGFKRCGQLCHWYYKRGVASPPLKKTLQKGQRGPRPCTVRNRDASTKI